MKNFHDLTGISLGFLIGMLFFQCIDYFVEMIESRVGDISPSTKEGEDGHEDSERLPILDMASPNYQATADDEHPLPRPSSVDIEVGSETSEDRSILLLAKQAMSHPMQRHHLIDELIAVIETLDFLQTKSNELSVRSLRSSLHRPHSSSASAWNTAELESLAETIDQETHKLQYSLDHCRRLIHGSGAGFESILPRIWITEQGIQHLNGRLNRMKELANDIYQILLSCSMANSIVSPPTLGGSAVPPLSSIESSQASSTENIHNVSHEERSGLQLIYPQPTRGAISSTINRPASAGASRSASRNRTPSLPPLHPPHPQGTPSRLENSSSPGLSQKLSAHQLKSLYTSLDEMEKELNHIHGTVEGYTYRWGKRSKSSNVPIPEIGSVIPMSFIVPVTIDCIVDGFLLGITAAVSSHAGFILSFANAIEMGFLGLAVSIRIQKCTGSSLIARYSAIFIPPWIMFFSSIFSFYGGSAIQENPIFFKLFISFGIVALLSLVINELLVEARDISSQMEGSNVFWSGMVFFLGIYAVILMEVLFPSSS